MNERQKQIVDAAIALILKEGVGVSTANIAKAAGVSNGTLFNAFATKQELIDTIYVTTKSGMFEALAYADGAEFTRENLYRNWSDYLDWARRNPSHRQIMHLLLESGLASEAARVRVDEIAMPLYAWFQNAFAQGAIRGPGVEFIGKLAFSYLDLVITQELKGDDEALAFEMLCQAIGLSQ